MTDTTIDRKATGSDVPRVFWLPQGCPAWCVREGQHEPSSALDDRDHDGEGVEIVTSLMETDRWIDRDGTYHESSDSPCLTLYLTQGFREAEPHVWLGRGQTNNGVDLTLGEARQLADRLVEI
ncbi:MAG TPA: hypothetical protein VF053_16290, partial [Streptosporangiales bacterium]